MRVHTTWFDIRIQESPTGGRNIVLRLDGTHTSIEGAEYVAAMFRGDIEAS